MLHITGQQAQAIADIADNTGNVAITHLTPVSNKLHRTIIVARDDGLVVGIAPNGTTYTRRDARPEPRGMVKSS